MIKLSIEPTRNAIDRLSLIWVLAVGITFLLLTIVAAVNSYSPVPFWDMWDGYLNFFIRVTDGDLSAWWQRHNDHRILLSRLLFWVDLKYFNGSMWLLLAANYFLAFSIWIVFVRIALIELRSGNGVALRRLFTLASFAMLFSWIQRDNFTWGFQNLMFAANLLPLLSFHFLGRVASSGSRESRVYFTASLAIGIAAAFTMVNGLATLPVMAVLALALRQSARRISIIVALAIAVITLYFYDTVADSRSNSSGSALHTFISHPSEVITFFLANVGAPFQYIFGGGTILAIAAGFGLICASLLFIYISIKGSHHRVSNFVLFAIIGYGLLTSLGTALARVEVWGIDYAFSSRYMTTIAVTWVAFALLAVLNSEARRGPRSIAIIALFFAPLVLIPSQVRAVRPDHDALMTRTAAAVALELGVRDDETIARLAGDVDHTIELAREPIERNLSIFGRLMLRDARKSLGTNVERHGLDCPGDIEERIPLPSDARFFRITGWIIDEYSGRYPTAAYVLDSNRNVVGYVISGFPRTGLSEGSSTTSAGFVGYLKREAANGDLYIRGRDISCEAKIAHTTTFFLNPVGFTDSNWVNGIARSWGPAFFIHLSDEIQKRLKVGFKVRFSDSSVRTITRIEIRQEDAIIYVDGERLDGAIVGFPRKIELLNLPEQ